MPQIPTTRQRDRLLRRDDWQGWRPSSSGVKYETGTVKIWGRQLTVSEGHQWEARPHYTGEDIGGDFFTVQRRFRDDRGETDSHQPQHSIGPIKRSVDNQYTRYIGPLYPLSPYSTPVGFANKFPPDLSSSDAEMDAIGTTAIARCKPTSSPANLSVAIGELVKDGIPSLIGSSLWKSRLKDIRQYGGEYLNVVFGWQPLIADIKDTYKAVKNLDDLMKQYERDSGRLVRRRYDFPEERSLELTDITPVGGADIYQGDRVIPASFDVDGNGRSVRSLTREREIIRNRWFSGAFTYYLPDDYSSRTALQQNLHLGSKLLGLELTPEVLWELTPWSWAADWVTNAGDVFSNVSDFASDGLVLRYGYVMEHTIIRDTYTNTGANLKCCGRRPITMTLVTEVKQRRRATPFGFGLDENSFTSRQKAIIAALGITRGLR